MKGYKAFNKDLTCRGFQYEVGKTYEMEENPEPCNRGFHFCETVANCYNYYPMKEDTRICEVEALGEVATDDNEKFCTNKIRIAAEVTEEYIRKANNNKSSSGYCNSGNSNSGNSNSGNRNSGDWNSGDWNSGYCNSGDCNSGDWNSGDRNSGNWNSGNWNSGSRNSGYWNSGNWNSGVFNTKGNPTIKMFDQESNWTIDDWLNSQARIIMSCCPYTYSDFVSKSDMTPEEIEKHPECETIGGYVKVFKVTDEDKQKWWDELDTEDKTSVMSLPNFDKDKFYKCTGIKIEEGEKRK